MNELKSIVQGEAAGVNKSRKLPQGVTDHPVLGA